MNKEEVQVDYENDEEEGEYLIFSVTHRNATKAARREEECRVRSYDTVH